MPNFLRNFGSTQCVQKSEKSARRTTWFAGKARNKRSLKEFFFQIQGFNEGNEETISNLFFKYSPLCLFGHGPYINSNSV